MTVFQLLRLAVAYVLLGAAGLALAIPPGYASPIFPAAGLAVATSLFYGHRAIPAIWLGSLTLNTAHSAMSGGFPTLNDVMVASLIACGSSLQAWTACWLVRRTLGDAWKRLENERDTLKFLLIGGVLTWIVAPSLDVSLLLVESIEPLHETSGTERRGA